MMLPIAHEQLRNMLGRRNSQIAHQAAMEHFRIVSINQVAGEIRAVMRHQIEAEAIWRRVVLANERIVLFFSRVQLETVNAAPILSSDQFDPPSRRRFAIWAVGRNRFKMISTILIS